MTRIAGSAEERLNSLSSEKTELLKLLIDEESGNIHKINPYPRVDGGDRSRVPTSWAQQRLWFIDQLESAGAAYYISMAIRLRGVLDQGALRNALDNVVKRHEVLRTVFVSGGDEPTQEIAAEGHFALQVIDLSDKEQAEREAQLQLHKIAEAHGRFDLSSGPLIRGRLLRVQADEHVLLVTMHHIVSDGWSIGVFIRELSQLYRANHEGRRDPLEPLRVQYGDYAQWQRQWLRAEVLEEQLRYWRTHLEGAAPQLELPTDRQRPALQSFRGESVRVSLDAQLTRRLKEFARSHELTLFMVLYAGWAILLARLSAQEDVVIGTPIANRQRPELEGLIGFFVNTLALRVQVNCDLLVDEFLHSVKEVTLGAYAHQDVPFEKLVEALQPARSLGRNPIFQVMFALQNAPKSQLRLPGLTAVREDPVNQSSKFDLLMSLEERDAQIVGTLNYATDIFDRETVLRWIESFKVLLGGMTDKIRNRLGDLPILAWSERHQLIDVFNATRASYPRDKMVHELIEEQVARTPDALALMHGEQSLTYVELNGRANQLARCLINHGVGPDRLVGICFERSLDMVTGLLGILKAGGAYLPLDPNYPMERLKHMVEDAAPQVILTQRELMNVLPETTAEVIAFDTREIAGNVKENVSAAELGLSARNLVYVIYTSGSTGRPKGTEMAHGSMVNLIEWHRRNFRPGERQRVLQFAALSFDVAFQEVFSTLCTGDTLVLLDEWIRRDPRALTEFLSSRSIERLFVPPLMLQSLAESWQVTGTVPGSLRDVITAGEQLRIGPEISGFFKQLNGCRLHNHYGPTETHVVTALTLTGNPERWPTLPTIGRPISNTQIYVLDGHLRPVPIGVAGEIYIGGAGVARGYLGQPVLTAQRFLDDPFSRDSGGRLYRTGDVGRWRADAMLEYLGRNDNQVKIRGYRIEPGEIEAQLARHEQVKEAAIVAREDIPGQKRLVAYITRREENGPNVEELRAYLKSKVPEYMVPSAFVALASFPLTPSGKLDRRALPTPDIEANSLQEHEPPQGKTETELANIWQELLGVERVGRHDNFFELGGHSLHGMRLITKIAAHFKVSLSAIAMFQYPTIQQMARAVESRRLLDREPLDSARMEYQEGVI